MALLDEAENLLAVLLASIEPESDDRAMQAKTAAQIMAGIGPSSDSIAMPP
jgi:hypothetical protein